QVRDARSLAIGSPMSQKNQAFRGQAGVEGETHAGIRQVRCRPFKLSGAGPRREEIRGRSTGPRCHDSQLCELLAELPTLQRPRSLGVVRHSLGPQQPIHAARLRAALIMLTHTFVFGCQQVRIALTPKALEEGLHLTRLEGVVSSLFGWRSDAPRLIP